MNSSILEINTYYASFFLHGQLFFISLFYLPDAIQNKLHLGSYFLMFLVSHIPISHRFLALTLPTDESGGFPFQRVPLEKIKAYILSVGV
jgi:hypothetical protein